MTKMTLKTLGAALGIGLMTLGGLTAAPAVARDHYGEGGYDRGRDGDRGGYGRDYDRGGYRYDRDSYRGGYERGYDRGYRGGYRSPVVYGGPAYYMGSPRYRGGAYRCRDNGVGGALIGAVAGGLLGNSVAERGDRTTGAVLGAAIGAVAGHAIDRNGGYRC